MGSQCRSNSLFTMVAKIIWITIITRRSTQNENLLVSDDRLAQAHKYRTFNANRTHDQPDYLDILLRQSE